MVLGALEDPWTTYTTSLHLYPNHITISRFLLLPSLHTSVSPCISGQSPQPQSLCSAQTQTMAGLAEVPAQLEVTFYSKEMVAGLGGLCVPLSLSF